MFCAGFPVPLSAITPDVPVSAVCAVLMEAETGRVLYAKNSNQTAAMASTTKIMTALLTLEAAAFYDAVVTITEDMVAVEGSSMGLQAGWKISLFNLAAGMLTVSGNDAARSAAIFLAGSEAAFAELMNARAEELGMVNTHFVTSSGLDAQEHFTTAEDMAVLAAAAMKNEAFRDIVSQVSYPVTFVSPEKTVTMANHNKLLWMLDGCVGLKTGYTRKAGRCLVSAVEREGVQLVCVTLNAPDDWNDHIRLFESAFSTMRLLECPTDAVPAVLPVVGGTAQQVPLLWDELPCAAIFGENAAVSVRIIAPAFLYAPVSAGTTVGQMEFYINDELVGTAALKAGACVPQQETEKTWWQKILLLFRIGE